MGGCGRILYSVDVFADTIISESRQLCFYGPFFELFSPFVFRPPVR